MIIMLAKGYSLSSLDLPVHTVKWMFVSNSSRDYHAIIDK